MGYGSMDSAVTFGNPISIKNYVVSKVSVRNIVETQVFMDIPFVLDVPHNLYAVTEYQKQQYTIRSHFLFVRQYIDDFAHAYLLPNLLRTFNQQDALAGAYLAEVKERHEILKRFKKYPSSRLVFYLPGFWEEGGSDNTLHMLASMGIKLMKAVIQQYKTYGLLLFRQERIGFLLYWKHMYGEQNNTKPVETGGISLYKNYQEEIIDEYQNLVTLADSFKLMYMG